MLLAWLRWAVDSLQVKNFILLLPMRIQCIYHFLFIILTNSTFFLSNHAKVNVLIWVFFPSIYYLRFFVINLNESWLFYFHSDWIIYLNILKIGLVPLSSSIFSINGMTKLQKCKDFCDSLPFFWTRTFLFVNKLFLI